MADVSGSGGIDPAQAARAEIKQEAAQGQLGRLAAQRSGVVKTLSEELQEAFNPFQADRQTQFKALKERRYDPSKRAQEMVEGTQVRKVASSDETAEKFEQRNPELEKQKLLGLLKSIMGSEDPEEILSAASEAFDDPSLVDEALEFLEQTTEGRTQEAVKEARSRLAKEKGREVAAGRNMGAESREWAKKEGLGSAGNLRDLYRDVTGNPRDHNQLFSELSDQYGYDELREVVDFLLHSLGSDLKSKGPSISRGELSRLTTEARVLQSILGVYRFFAERMDLLERLFLKHDLKKPDKLTFEAMAKAFMSLVDERYPSISKLMRLGKQLGLSDEALAQIILFEQFRDAIRQVSPRLYHSLKHRYDLLMTIIEALEELEEELEEEEEEDDDDEE